jgi:MYXO-CTERM domain-containing protein
MKKVKRFVAAAAVAMAASSVMADPINFDADGPGIFAPVQANQFDWLPGNALAVGGNQAVANFLANQSDGGNRPTNFTLLYQARLTAITNAANANVTPAGLDYPIPNPPTANEFEITIVAALQERVTAVLGNTALFDDAGVPQTNNFVEVYFDNNFATRANDLAGTGFNDGLRIASGVVDIVNSNFTTLDNVAPHDPLDQAGGVNNYPGQLTVSGLGVTGLEATINPASLNPAFWVDLPTALTFHLFTTTVNGLLPIGAGAGGPSIQLQADASNTFTQTPGIVPEPATAMLGLMGLAGLAFGRRSRRA